MEALIRVIIPLSATEGQDGERDYKAIPGGPQQETEKAQSGVRAH